MVDSEDLVSFISKNIKAFWFTIIITIFLKDDLINRVYMLINVEFSNYINKILRIFYLIALVCCM